MSNDETRKAMLREVYLRNLIARYKDVNLGTRGTADIPRVGVFWFDVNTNSVYAESSSIRDAEDYAGLRIGAQHFESWDTIVKENPVWMGVRGQVVLDMTPRRSRFLIYACPLLDDKETKKVIVDAFLLPEGHYEFDFNDEHYEIR